MRIALLYSLLCIFSVGNYACLAQEEPKSLDSILYVLDRSEFNEARSILENTNLKQLSNDNKSLYFIASSQLAIHERDDIGAYEHLLTAKRYSNGKKNRNTFIANELLINLAAELANRKIDVANLMSENCTIAHYLKDPKLKFNCLFPYFADELTAENDIAALQIGYHLKKIATQNNLINELEGLESNLGTIHYFMKNKDSSNYYYSRALERRRQQADTASIILHLNNYARIQESTGDYVSALSSLNEAELLLNAKPKDDIRAVVFKGKATLYELLGNDKLAIVYLKRFNNLSDSLNNNTLTVEIAELQSKYNATEKEKQNVLLIARNSNNQKQIYLLLLIITVIGAAGTVFVIHKNRKEKLLIAQNEAQKQKDLKLLKEQELSSINAMVEGQERERKRISRQLHDDLGSNLTTVRIYLENAKEKVRDASVGLLLSNAHNILLETYQKVRSISHINNSSILGEGNLIQAVEKLSATISDAGKVDVEFVHHNLDQPLSNSLEISLFRTIQELLNNVLKHAHATEATVNITGYEHYLDLTVEDNGVGFIKKTMQHNMGLSTISHRVQALAGAFTIDSSPGNGTTINIEIPLI